MLKQSTQYRKIKNKTMAMADLPNSNCRSIAIKMASAITYMAIVRFICLLFMSACVLQATNVREIAVVSPLIKSSVMDTGSTFDDSNEEYREYCETESFNASCPDSQVIIVRQARYGRMKLGRCVSRDYGYVGCQVEVLAHMDAMCSGTSRCHVRIPDPTLDRVNRCPKDLKTYLEVSYECVKVHKADCGCDRNETATAATTTTIATTTTLSIVASTFGFISGELPLSVGCRNTAWCPLYIRASPGQQINISLWDFTLEEEERNLIRQQMHGDETCYRYAVILEKTREVDVCGSWSNVKHVYISQENQLEIRLISTLVRDKVPKYLLRYQVIGCADIPKQPNAVVQRDDHWTTVTCLHGGSNGGAPGGLRFKAICQKNEWIGTIGKCPEGPAAVANDAVADLTGDQSPGLFVGIVIGIAFLFGAIVLVLGLLVIRGRRLLNALSPPPPPPLSSSSKQTSWIRQFVVVEDASPNQEATYNGVISYSSRDDISPGQEALYKGVKVVKYSPKDTNEVTAYNRIVATYSPRLEARKGPRSRRQSGVGLVAAATPCNTFCSTAFNASRPRHNSTTALRTSPMTSFADYVTRGDLNIGYGYHTEQRGHHVSCLQAEHVPLMTSQTAAEGCNDASTSLALTSASNKNGSCGDSMTLHRAQLKNCHEHCDVNSVACCRNISLAEQRPHLQSESTYGASTGTPVDSHSSLSSPTWSSFSQFKHNSPKCTLKPKCGDSFGRIVDDASGERTDAMWGFCTPTNFDHRELEQVREIATIPTFIETD